MYASGAWRGYWEQEGYGRGVMDPLTLRFEAGQIQGEGYDVVGTFTFAGRYEDSGRVFLVKHYIGAHEVMYVGQSDGEGTIYGEWQIGSDFRGPFALSPMRDEAVADLPILRVGAPQPD